MTPDGLRSPLAHSAEYGGNPVMSRTTATLVAAFTLGVFSVAAAAPRTSGGPAAVDTQRIISADREPGNWMAVGRTYSEQRYSALRQITEHNVNKLGLAW